VEAVTATLRCPWCRRRPASGPEWRCDSCGAPYNPFETDATCPECVSSQPAVECRNCGAHAEIAEWRAVPECPACGHPDARETPWACEGCGEECDPLGREDRCVRCAQPLLATCPACGAAARIHVWAGEDSLAYHEAVSGAPEWSCPPTDGIAPHATVRWTVMRTAWLVERRGFEDLRRRPHLLPERLPASPREALDAIVAHAQVVPPSSDFDPEDLDAHDLVLLSARRWLECEAGFAESTADADALAALAAVHLGFGCLAVTSGRGPAVEIVGRSSGSWPLTEEELHPALALALAMRGESVETAIPSIRRAHVAALRRCAGFFHARSDLLDALCYSPSSILRGVRWI
jgi:hypothetical protein